MSFDEQPDGDPHGECATAIARLTAELTEWRELYEFGLNDRNELLARAQTAEAYAARNALRVIELQDALRKIVRDGDYTAPEGMKRIANEALATELETKGEQG